MARKSYAKSTYAVRLDNDVTKELQRRATEELTTVSALIRRAIDGYLNERDASDMLMGMEERIAATIRQLSRYQLQTRRVADISLAQNEYLLRLWVVNSAIKRQEGEDSQAVYRRILNEFMRWLPGALSATGAVRRMIKQVLAPGFIVDEAPPNPPDEDDSDGAEPSAEATAAESV